MSPAIPMKFIKWTFIKSLFSVFCFLQMSIAFAQLPSNPTPPPRDSSEHIPGLGFQVFDGKKGSLSISFFATFRYLNQKGFDSTFTDSFGRSFNVKRRNDMQFQKLMIYFKGWITNPKFRYLFYAWTANTNLGLPAQVVLGGNFQYLINKHFDVGAGIGGLPATRGLIGQWPFWLRSDNRPMAEEFFRGSFTTGIWMQGEITRNLYYKTMLGNNLSQLGVNANQLDGKLDTYSLALWWSSSKYGRISPYGDFNKTPILAGTFGAAYTRSTETKQSQPSSEKPENTQLRLSDGTIIFNENAFGPGLGVNQAKYEMTSINTGVKLKGYSLDFEYYLRWLSKFKSDLPLPVNSLFDHGFSTQASGIVIPQKLQVYGQASKLFGQYGKPWEVGVGINWYPFMSRMLRINGEFLHVKRSPVGYISYVTNVGATGNALMVNLELFF